MRSEDVNGVMEDKHDTVFLLLKFLIFIEDYLKIY